MAPTTRSDPDASAPEAAPARRSVAAGTWVELWMTILEPGQRAPGIPADTQAHPFVGRVRGFLIETAAIGEPAAVRTLIGRTVEGTLSAVHPRNPADFGDPSPELLDIAARFRADADGQA
jgi:2-amino-4-ketopentanoate thiolase alpha subunit